MKKKILASVAAVAFIGSAAFGTQAAYSAWCYEVAGYNHLHSQGFGSYYHYHYFPQPIDVCF